MKTGRHDISQYFGFLAHHCEHAGETKLAIKFGIRAGKRALQVNANNEAAAFFTKALQLIEKEPEEMPKDVVEGCHVDLAEGEQLRCVYVAINASVHFIAVSKGQQTRILFVAMSFLEGPHSNSRMFYVCFKILRSRAWYVRTDSSCLRCFVES